MHPSVTFGLVVLAAILNIANLSYDASLINNLNSVPAYFEHFNLTSGLVGLNVAIVNAGSIVSGPFAGLILDKWGRKRGMVIGSSIAATGAAIQASAPNERVFAAGRLLLGFSLTIAATASPTWVMELAHPKTRGIWVGILMSSLPFMGLIVSCILLGIYNYSSDWQWRGPVLGELLTPLMAMAILPFTPESPRWLLYKGRKEEALKVLAYLHADGNRNDVFVQAEFEEISNALEYEKEHEGPWKSLWTPLPNLRRFLITVLINIFFQISGSNTIIYFLTIIIANTGIENLKDQLLVNLGICIWNTIAVVAGGFVIEKMGRKATLLTGTGIMTVSLALLAILVHLSETRRDSSYGIGAIVVIFIFQLASCGSWMHLAYSYPPEVLSYTQRTKGIAAGQAVGYAFAFINTYTLPIAIEEISWRYYAINSGWNVVIMAVIWLLFVETKGKTLEEVDRLFTGLVHIEGVVLDGEDQKSSSPDENQAIRVVEKVLSKKRKVNVI
ncbi:hypothetical protein GTA08_BOTSDO12531 [Neofusicoccum parvum]|uniref:Uncharacterized protein n=1 Tax=Neofusicoccum parvum TaxID=310453 RepID=A0ACB5RTD4_9PEZI|nr:hypothetical protein GTA08_BOTSDO12531 [Neofusicoccum parvum]